MAAKPRPCLLNCLPGVWRYSAVTFGIFCIIEIVRNDGGVQSNQYAFIILRFLVPTEASNPGVRSLRGRVNPDLFIVAKLDEIR